jgi:hypothetical protein
VVDDLRTALKRDRLHGQLRQRAVADRTKIVFAGIAFQERDQFTDAIDAQLRIHLRIAGKKSPGDPEIGETPATRASFAMLGLMLGLRERQEFVLAQLADETTAESLSAIRDFPSTIELSR